MAPRVRADRGFSLTELMLVIAVVGTMAAVSVPILTNLSEGTKLNTAARELERELQSARLKAVSTNRALRVRLNCPAVGFYRTVEVLGTAADTASNRCLQSAYPYPVTNTDIIARPRHDGPVRLLLHNATVTTTDLEFRPDGSIWRMAGGVPQAMGTSQLTITVTRYGKTKGMSVNGAGRIQIQQ